MASLAEKRKALEDELREIENERRQVDKRLRDMEEQRRLGGGRGVPIAPDRRDFGRFGPPRNNVYDRDGPGLKRRVITTTAGVRRAIGVRDEPDRAVDRRREDERPKLSSAVVGRDDDKASDEPSSREGLPEESKSPFQRRREIRVRSRESSHTVQKLNKDEDSQKRNKRLFGALMGHLNKAKDRLVVDMSSETMKKKEELEEKALHKMEEHRQALRAHSIQEYREKREKEIQHKLELLKAQRHKENALLEVVVGEHQERLSLFLFTRTDPRIFFMPAKHNDASRKLLEDCKEDITKRISEGGFVKETKEEDEEWEEREKQRQARRAERDRERAKALGIEKTDGAENSQDVDKIATDDGAEDVDSKDAEPMDVKPEPVDD